MALDGWSKVNVRKFDLNSGLITKWLSSNPCSDTYAGPVPESEPETKAVVDSINKKLGEWDAFISIHSKGQWWLTPFGYSTTVLPVDNDDILAAANIGADAIKNYNGNLFKTRPKNSNWVIIKSVWRFYFYRWPVVCSSL